MRIKKGSRTLIFYECCSNPAINTSISAHWFHGDTLDLRVDKIENLIGFKCYTCLKKGPPVCPHHCSTGSKKLSETKTKTKTIGEDSDCFTPPEDGSALNDNSKAAYMAVNMEKQLPEEVQKDDDFTLKHDKGELLNAVETQSTIPNKEPECSALMEKLMKNCLTD